MLMRAGQRGWHQLVAIPERIKIRQQGLDRQAVLVIGAVVGQATVCKQTQGSEGRLLSLLLLKRALDQWTVPIFYAAVFDAHFIWVATAIPAIRVAGHRQLQKRQRTG